MPSNPPQFPATKPSQTQAHQPRWRTSLPATLLSLAMLAAASPAHADPTMERAQARMSANDAKGAFDILLPLEAQRAGIPAYDYLLGIAALDAGDPQRAIFALERVLAVEPNNARARAELARAYLAVGNQDGARQEFDNVRRMNPPADVRATIDRYLAAISTPEAERPVRGYLGFGLGRDTNINTATSQSSIFFPGLNLTGTFTGTQQRANFASLMGGVEAAFPLNENWAAVGSVNANTKRNIGKSYDSLDLSANAGVRYTLERHRVTVLGNAAALKVDDPTIDTKRRSTGAMAQWQFQAAERTQIGLTGQLSHLRYPGQEVRNAKRKIVGAQLGHGFVGAWSPYVFASAYTGREKARDANFQVFSFRPIGAALGAQVTLAPSVTATASTSFERRRYAAFDAAWGNTRRDTTWDARFGVQWAFAPTWSLNPEVSFTRNRSNQALSQFSRTMVSATVRKEF
jgi:outer membrane protein